MKAGRERVVLAVLLVVLAVAAGFWSREPAAPDAGPSLAPAAEDTPAAIDSIPASGIADSAAAANGRAHATNTSTRVRIIGTAPPDRPSW